MEQMREMVLQLLLICKNALTSGARIDSFLDFDMALKDLGKVVDNLAQQAINALPYLEDRVVHVINAMFGPDKVISQLVLVAVRNENPI